MKHIYVLILILIYNCSGKSDSLKKIKNHYFIKVEDTYVSKYEISNIQFVNFLNSALDKREIQIDSMLNIIGYYEGDRYYKSGDKLLYKIVNESPIKFNNNSFNVDSIHANMPIVKISWYAAYKYCSFYDFELPSEEVWLKISKNELPVSDIQTTIMPASSIIDSNIYGIINIHSNVSEWIYPFYDDRWPYKQIRGSSFKNQLTPLDKKIGNFAPQLLEDVGFRPIIIPPKN